MGLNKDLSGSATTALAIVDVKVLDPFLQENSTGAPCAVTSNVADRVEVLYKYPEGVAFVKVILEASRSSLPI